MFGANFVILAQIYDELSRGQAKFPWILSQNGQNDHEGQDQWPQVFIPEASLAVRILIALAHTAKSPVQGPYNAMWAPYARTI